MEIFDKLKKKNKIMEKNNSVKSFLNNKKLLFITSVILIFSLILTIFIVNSINKENEEKFNGYEIKIHIDFPGNLIFSKYDVLLYSGNQKTLLSHGEDKDVIFYLENGTHTLTFESKEDSSIKNELTIDVSSNIELEYRISCYFDRIDVKNLYIDRDIQLKENEIKIDFDKQKFKNKKYEDVISTLKNLGFTNIIENPKYDIVFFEEDAGEVESVTINGNDKYKRGNIFTNDVEIIVSYRLKQNDDPSRITLPYDSESANDLNYEEVVNAFKDAGFNNVTTDLKKNKYQSLNHKVYKLTINGHSVNQKDKYKPDDKVVIYYYYYYDYKNEEKSLSYYTAKKAFENYGKAMYKYGFKCHWIKNLIDAQDRDDGSIYYKVGVTITNQYNASYDAVAEGVVSGTDDNPKISNFRVIE